MMVASQRSSVLKELSCFLSQGTCHNTVTLYKRRYISHDIPIEKLIKYGVNKSDMDCYAQRVVTGNTQPGCQSLMVYPGVNNGASINGLEEHTLNKSAGNPMLGEVVDRSDGCHTMQRDLDRSEK